MVASTADHLKCRQEPRQAPRQRQQRRPRLRRVQHLPRQQLQRLHLRQRQCLPGHRDRHQFRGLALPRPRARSFVPEESGTTPAI